MAKTIGSPNALRSKYQLSEDDALRTHKNCQAAQQRQTNPNPHDCYQYLNDAECLRKMAGSVRTLNRLTGRVTDPPRGSTRKLPGGVAARVIYGVGTNQGRFNEDISQGPVVDSRGLIGNSNREGEAGYAQILMDASVPRPASEERGALDDADGLGTRDEAGHDAGSAAGAHR